MLPTIASCFAQWIEAVRGRHKTSETFLYVRLTRLGLSALMQSYDVGTVSLLLSDVNTNEGLGHDSDPHFNTDAQRWPSAAARDHHSS
jgi:hypothetical protein